MIRQVAETRWAAFAAAQSARDGEAAAPSIDELVAAPEAYVSDE